MDLFHLFVGGSLLPFMASPFLCCKSEGQLSDDPWLRDISQMGSLAGAAYLLNFNAGVLKARSVRTEILRSRKG